MDLEINIGEEYKIKIEKTEEFEKSIFKDVYTQATKNVEEIILQANTVSNTNSISNDDYNNVIAFTGERGTGKSSSMISFADALKNKNSKDTFWSETPNLEKAKIKSLDIIDPSLFRNEDKLFEIIISKMFSKFQKKLKKENTIKNDRKRDLIKQFQKVFNNLKVVHNGKSDVYEKEAIEALSDLAFGTNLKENFKKLVDEYLLCMYGIDNSKDKKGFLLIPIDDFDLNISGAYEMLEDIRQFLIQSNVIILIACKMEQLQDSVNQEIVQNFKTIINNDTIQNVYLSEEVNDKSERYLDKLLPIERRINTPDLSVNNSSDIVLKINGKDSDESIEKVILELIYQKTKHIVTSNGFKNIIIPSTIRNIANITTFIYREKNIEAYKRILFKGINSDLTIEYRNFFKELENVPNKALNQYIVNWIGSENNKRKENSVGKNFKRSLFPEIDTPSMSKVETLLYRNINRITEASNYANVSYADVMLLIRSLEEYRLFSDKDLFKLYSYIKLYYSLRISLSDKTELLQLVNGEMTNSFLKFLPSEQGGDPRHEFKIEHKPLHLFELIEDRIDLPNFKENKEKENKEIEGYSNTKEELYYWLSFFFTYIGTPVPMYRNVSEVEHEKKIKKIGNQPNTVNFNSIAFIHNALSPKLVFERFSLDENKDAIKETQLFIDLEDWNKKLKESSNYYDIFNFQLFDEFLNQLYKISESNSLDSNGSFGKDLHSFVITGISKVIIAFKEKYSYLDLAPLLENPIIKYWNTNKDSVTSLLNLIRDVKNEDEDKEEAIKIAKGYIKNIKRAKKDKAGTVNNLIKLIKGYSFDGKDEIVIKLKEFSTLFKESKTDIDISNYLKDITGYLNNLEV